MLHAETENMTVAHNAHSRDVRAVELRMRLADGRTLAWLELGDPHGRPVFYFHGYPGSRLEGRLAAGTARRLGLRLLAPDRPGIGASTFQPGRTIGAWADDVAQLADRLALTQFSVVGVSGGGPYALACAARIPARVRGVALVAAIGPLARTDLTNGMVTLNRLALVVAAHAPWVAQMGIGLAARFFRRYPQRYLARMLAVAPPADRQVLADAGYRALLDASTAEALRPGGRGVAWELTLLARPWDFQLGQVCMPAGRDGPPSGGSATSRAGALSARRRTPVADRAPPRRGARGSASGAEGVDHVSSILANTD